MKSYLHLCLAATLGLAASAHGQTPAPAAAPASVSFADALTQGKVNINGRLRYESVEQDGLQDADAVTARLRLGYTTKAYKGFQAMVEGEAVSPLTNDYYDGTGPNTVPPTATVADPEVYNLNQAWLSYTFEKTKGTLGRQKIVLDNARFVGDVGWRQNDQTFDAFLLQDKSLDKTTLTYGYIDYVNRVFDNSVNQQNWHSDSHLINVSYAGLPIGTLTGYAYLLDLDSQGLSKAGANGASCQTYGVSLVGTKPVTKKLKASYRLEYATQADYGDNATDYSADYYVAELGAAYDTYTFGAGYEVLGSDKGTVGFKTPLATLHAFNGWADVFLNTPAAGLTDTYVKAGTTLPGAVGLTAFYHIFGTEDGAATLGEEFDIVATYKLNKQLSFTAKAAKYWSDQASVLPAFNNADRTKLWLQTDYAF
jgi:hypothetical protein